MLRFSPTRRRLRLPTIFQSIRRSDPDAEIGSETRPKVIFSGIQPTGVPHLGNYLGALRQWVKLQEEAEADTTLLYSLVDLHAITVKQEAKQLRTWKKEMLATLLAVGLNPERSVIFHQSDVSHSMLTWNGDLANRSYSRFPLIRSSCGY